MSVSLHDFFRTGVQDCENVFDATDFDVDALRGTVDAAVLNTCRAAVVALLDESDVSQIEELAVEAGLDPAAAVDAWKRGWLSEGTPRLAAAVME